MAVSVTNQKSASEAQQETIDLELSLFVRLVDKDRELYEKGKVYTFTREAAAQKLKQLIDGKPVFKRHVPKGNRKVVEVHQPKVDMTRTKAQEVSLTLQSEPTKRLEIGTPEEEAELGLTSIDESSEEQDGGHEV